MHKEAEGEGGIGGYVICRIIDRSSCLFKLRVIIVFVT